MQDQILCPHCKQSIPLTQAISHQIADKYRKLVEEDRKKQADMYEKKLQDERLKMHQETTEKIRLKIQQEMELKFKDKENESIELNKKLQQMQADILETHKTNRLLKMESEQKILEFEKKLAAEQAKIREEEQKRLDDQYRLKILEFEKKLQDASIANEEMKRKLEQGSQQTQGEVLELEIEQMLRQSFPHDDISPVAKGVRGADVLQVVKNNFGQECGTIVWELKRTKAWSNEWITKLKDDQRNIKADVAIIISQVLPPDIKSFGNKDGVMIGNYESIMALAGLLRGHLIDINSVKLVSVGKAEKMEILYNYLAGNEFKMRVEAIVEAFTAMQDDIEREKRWFTAKWAKQEKYIRKVIDNTVGMHGDLQGIMGKSLGEIKGLEMLPEMSVDNAEPLF
jgi:hypothetical protein